MRLDRVSGRGEPSATPEDRAERVSRLRQMIREGKYDASGKMKLLFSELLRKMARP